MTHSLPTGSFATWSVTAFKDSLSSVLKDDDTRGNAVLRLYFYAATLQGWKEIRGSVRRWRKFDRHRKALAYVGTDHAITGPEGLKAMRDDAVVVRLMKNYQGVFHPKVVWLDRSARCQVWIGSNNLTRDGLLNNIEFSAIIQCKDAPGDLRRWAENVHTASVELTESVLESYRRERREFERSRMRTGAKTFTWSLKSEQIDPIRPPVEDGDLIVEVMPKETGEDGKQIQLPVQAAKLFFKLVDSKEITLTEKGKKKSGRKLRMTLFRNHTVRLVIRELGYRDRPCVVLFHRTKSERYQFEIIPESIFPSRYRALLELCDRRTRAGSRRWCIAGSEG